jgi:hypothetical protein
MLVMTMNGIHMLLMETTNYSKAVSVQSNHNNFNHTNMAIKKQSNNITCPNCKHSIPIEEALYQKLEKEYRQKLEMGFNLEKEKLREELEKESTLKLSEKNQLIDSLKNQLKGMHRKIELTSQQIQGEAQELMLQEFLKNIYPLDSVVEVPKGVNGADCIQQVNTREKQNLGSILYESKRTRNWSNGWIPKFKEDLRIAGCTFGVIVTEAMPNDMPRMGSVEGIWVCTVHEIKVLSAILREAIILYGTAIVNNENSNEKANLLYSYLISPQFKMEIEAIVDSFIELDKELSREKRAMTVYWKTREANIKKAVRNVVSLYGSFKSIADSAIPPISRLELPEGDNTAE